jgi:alcohol dehydrogenase, propanol-preferring
MRAMLLESAHQALRLADLPIPEPGPGQVLVRVRACGVCRTDLHIVDGELEHPALPLVPGHEIAGEVAAVGKGVTGFAPGQGIGVPWLGSTDGTCRYCQRGQENLCEHPDFTGYTLPGGYAEYTLADQRYCFRLPEGYDFVHAAPLLCAGLIGYRSYRMAQELVPWGMQRLGLYGFGAAAHIIAQVAVQRGQQVYAFTRTGDAAAQAFARSLGAAWAGGSDEQPPEPLDAAILFAPVGALLPAALRAVDKGGAVICGGIHMSPIPSFPYDILWEERSVRSVANLERRDGEEFLALVERYPVQIEVQPYPLEAANQALADLRAGRVQGAAVLTL